MAKDLENLYARYYSEIVTFNQQMIQELGLISDQIYFKVGGFKYPCVLYSSSMEEARLMCYLKMETLKFLKDHNERIFLNLTFQPAGSNRPIHFFVHSRIESRAPYEGQRPDLYVMQVCFLNRAPDDLVRILGEHLKSKSAMQKRMEQRVPLKSKDEKEMGINTMKSLLFAAGKSHHCVLTELSIFSAKVLIQGKPETFHVGDRVMLVMQVKNLEGVGEMMGAIERLDPINTKEGFFALIIHFDQESVPPSYKLWIAECIEKIALQLGGGVFPDLK